MANKKLELNAHERLTMINILPQKGNLEQQLTVMEIVGKIRLDEKEAKDINYNALPDGRISYNKAKADELLKTIELTGGEYIVIKDGVDKLSKTGEITQTILPICKKIKEL